MEHRLSATELARNVGDVLARIRYRGDTFVIERNGEPVARILPAVDHTPTTVREAVEAWRSAGRSEPEFAGDLESVDAEDRTPESPWDF